MRAESARTLDYSVSIWFLPNGKNNFVSFVCDHMVFLRSYDDFFWEKNERWPAATAVDHIRLEKNCYGGKNDSTKLYRARMPNEEFN
jgi:hypothetical protein